MQFSVPSKWEKSKKAHSIKKKVHSIRKKRKMI